MKVKSESKVAQSCPTLATPWTAAYQALSSMGFSRQEYWSGVPLPSPTIPLLTPRTTENIQPSTFPYYVVKDRGKRTGWVHGSSGPIVR